MTPLTRYEVAGPGAVGFLQRLTTNNVDKSVGSVTYTLMLDETGGVRSDLTVARLAGTLPGRRQRAAGLGLADPAPARGRQRDGARHHRRHLLRRRLGARWPATWSSRCAPTTSRTRRSSTSARCDLPRCHPGDHDAGVLCRRTRLGDLHQRRIRCGAVGPAVGAGQEHGVIAAGRIAFNSLRIEKGYRALGHRHDRRAPPAAAGLDFAVRMAKDDFIGKAALEAGAAAREGPAQHRLRRSRPPWCSARNRCSVGGDWSATSPAPATRPPSAGPSPTRGCPPHRAATR